MNAWREILAAARGESEALDAACRNAGSQQRKWLLQLVAGNALTQFGVEHRFGEIDSVEAFRRRVPIRRYEALKPWIERIVNGESNVLTSADVISFEETSGTTTGSKLIPYTANSLAAFRAAILPWLARLAHRRPGIIRGPAYVAASPVNRAPHLLPCGITVGLPSEAAYLGEDLFGALGALMAVPPLPLSSIDVWRHKTLAHLVKCHELAFVSIWSPTFLLELIESLPRDAESVLRELRASSLADERSDAAAMRLERALAGSRPDTHELWPQLDTISMWTDGASAPFAARVSGYFPNAFVDGKGLLSTEGAVSVRLDDEPGCVPALTSAVLEFMNDSGECRFSDELIDGAMYRVIVTTPGGLYRYDTGDQVRCVCLKNGAPRLRFVGRAGIVSDLVGEKLTEGFVSEAVSTLACPVALVPRTTPAPHYEIWVDAADAGDAERFADAVDKRLRRNTQYAYARDLGQLRPPITVLHPGFVQHRRHALVARGQKLGDVKHSSLILDRTTLPDRRREAIDR